MTPSPPLQVGHQALGSKLPDFGRKIGRNLSVTISNSDLCSSQIFWSFCPPPFQNHAYATENSHPPLLIPGYAPDSNNVATLLAELLLSQLSLQIKNNHKKLSSLGNFEFVLSKAVYVAFLAAQTFSFTATVNLYSRFSCSVEFVA